MREREGEGEGEGWMWNVECGCGYGWAGGFWYGGGRVGDLSWKGEGERIADVWRLEHAFGGEVGSG